MCFDISDKRNVSSNTQLSKTFADRIKPYRSLSFRITHEWRLYLIVILGTFCVVLCVIISFTLCRLYKRPPSRLSKNGPMATTGHSQRWSWNENFTISYIGWWYVFTCTGYSSCLRFFLVQNRRCGIHLRGKRFRYK